MGCKFMRRRCFAERSIRVSGRLGRIVVEEMDGRSNEVDVFADVFRNGIGLAAYRKSVRHGVCEWHGAICGTDQFARGQRDLCRRNIPLSKGIRPQKRVL